MDQNKDQTIVEELGGDVKQVEALNRIVMTILDKKHSEDRLTKIVLIISILVNVVISAMFIRYESNMATVQTETSEYIAQETDGSSDINNVEGDQYNDNASHTEGNAD